MNAPRRLTVGALLVLGAAASCGASHRSAAGGGRIVFQRLDPASGTLRLYSIAPDGTGLRALTSPRPGAQADSHPDVSPDGRRVVFQRIVGLGGPDERTQLFVVGSNGGTPRLLTGRSCRGTCVSSAEPAWSPNGRRIAFVRTVGPLPPSGGPPPIVGIAVVDAAGTHLRQLTQRTRSSGTEDHAPTWSPDGTRIAFLRVNNLTRPGLASAIWVMNADGSRARSLRVIAKRWLGGGAPAWSPDGKRLLYSTFCWFGACGQPPTGAQLFTVGVDGGGAHQLTHLAGNAESGRWSPAGTRVVFAAGGRVGEGSDLYTAAAAGGRVRRLTHAPAAGSSAPDWGRSP